MAQYRALQRSHWPLDLGGPGTVGLVPRALARRIGCRAGDAAAHPASAVRGLQWSRRTRAARRRVAGARCAGIALLLLGGCQAEREAVPPQEEAAGRPLQITERVELRESEAGRLRWRLVADSALAFAGDERTLLRGVAVSFYDEQGERVRSTLTAREGEVDEKRGDLLARGDVVVITDEGHRLETERLRWDSERGKVISQQFVRLTKGGSVITGVGIETDPELRSYVIQSQVEGAVREEDEILDAF
ncbi:MAG: LPS export ABC transporter periplasmic protein LptC [Candidatus Eisenbacteria bacterium]|nr:LPS export ABC transporter periplasmic protein LptC [Candidatus Eisenbacteria bacterium]